MSVVLELNMVCEIALNGGKNNIVVMARFQIMGHIIDCKMYGALYFRLFNKTVIEV